MSQRHLLCAVFVLMLAADPLGSNAGTISSSERLTRSLVVTINSSSERKIAAFVRDNVDITNVSLDSWASPCCDAHALTRTLTNLALRSHGLSVDGLNNVGPNTVAFLKSKEHGQKIYMHVESDEKQPARIKNVEILSLSPEAATFLPTMGGEDEGAKINAIGKALRVAESQGLFSGTVLLA